MLVGNLNKRYTYFDAKKRVHHTNFWKALCMHAFQNIAHPNNLAVYLNHELLQVAASALEASPWRTICLTAHLCLRWPGSSMRTGATRQKVGPTSTPPGSRASPKSCLWAGAHTATGVVHAEHADAGSRLGGGTMLRWFSIRNLQAVPEEDISQRPRKRHCHSFPSQ